MASRKHFPLGTDYESEFQEIERIYARNLIVANRVGALGSPRGLLPTRSGPWFVAEVTRWAGEHPGVSKALAGRLRAIQEEARGRPTPAGLSSGRIGANIRALSRLLRLTRGERAILQFKLAMLLVPGVQDAVEDAGRMPTVGAASFIARITGEPADSIRRALEPDSTLVHAGLVVVEPGTVGIDQKICFPRQFTDLLTGPRLTSRRFAQAWLPVAPPPTLTASDYGHLGPVVDRLRALLSEALDRRECGVNVLLHGPTGTGKTELARLLALEVGAELRMAGTTDQKGSSPSFYERIGSLATAQRVLGRTRSIILFDEMEDLFETQGHSRRSTLLGSKAFLTGLLERNAVPVIWATNDTASMDPAVLRRFVTAVELPPLDESRRRAVWNRAAGGVIPEQDVARLARRFVVSPASIAGAVRATRLSCGGRVDSSVAEDFLAGNVLATGVYLPPAAAPVIEYQPGLLRASVDLESLAERLLRAGPRVSATICLHGPPGTGKSEWVRHLAERMGRRVHAHCVSDIESKWVGESEKNLALAFHLAEREGAILLFDEADSFLLDRRNAFRHWEVALTNEFLQRLEAAQGIVACTTNTFDALDPAVMRRFSVKVELGYLEATAAARLFATAFEPHLGKLDDLAAARVAAQVEVIGAVAPGDFAAVVRRLPFLGEPPTVEALLRELEQEVAVRRGGLRRVAGFRRESDPQSAERT
jgi:SpoVK/Ycf46/Vps4 family AAA+-type ATPase